MNVLVWAWSAVPQCHYAPVRGPWFLPWRHPCWAGQVPHPRAADIARPPCDLHGQLSAEGSHQPEKGNGIMDEFLFIAECKTVLFRWFNLLLADFPINWKKNTIPVNIMTVDDLARSQGITDSIHQVIPEYCDFSTRRGKFNCHLGILPATSIQKQSTVT